MKRILGFLGVMILSLAALALAQPHPGINYKMTAISLEPQEREGFSITYSDVNRDCRFETSEITNFSGIWDHVNGRLYHLIGQMPRPSACGCPYVGLSSAGTYWHFTDGSEVYSVSQDKFTYTKEKLTE